MMFNESSRCSPVRNSSTLSNFSYKTEKDRRYTSDNQKFESEQIIWMGWCFHRMIQLCRKTIIKALKNLFGSSLTAGFFPENWKKDNITPVYKKESKNYIKNFWPITLLPIFSKRFERPIFNGLFNFFIQNQLFTDCWLDNI